MNASKLFLESETFDESSNQNNICSDPGFPIGEKNGSDVKKLGEEAQWS